MKRTISILLLLLPYLGFFQSFEMIGIQGKAVRPEMVLQDFIRIPSVSGSEKQAGEFLAKICELNGLYVSMLGTENGNYNFGASIFPLEDKKPNIIFLNHLDVVPENDTAAFGPFSGRIEAGNIYGRGAVDNKGTAMMQLYALVKLRARENFADSPYNITMLSVSCEETQCEGGVAYVLEHFEEKLNAVAVIGEGPTEITNLLEGDFEHALFGISLAHKRALWLELELRQEIKGHGSITPNAYPNKELVEALHRLTKKNQKAVFNELNTRFLKELSEHYSGASKFAMKNPRLMRPFLVKKLRQNPELFSIFSNTVTLTNIGSNGNAMNKNSTVAWAQIDCRLLPDTDERKFLNEVKKQLKNDSIKVKVIRSLPRNEPSVTGTIFYENLKAAIKEGYPHASTIRVMMPNINDLGYFRARGIPSYGSVPIVLSHDAIENIHGENEYLSIEALHKGAEVYNIFMKKMIYHSGSE